MVNNNQERIDRRKHTRFQVKENAFVVLGAESQPHATTKVGKIIDISMGGLAFQYLADEERSNGSFELGIFLAYNGFHLRKIPFQTIWDVETDRVHSSFVTTRSSGVQFGKMTPGQISGLEHLIQIHTTAEV